MTDGTRRLWLAAGWILVAAVWYLSLTPAPPELLPPFRASDKVGHALAYLILMLWQIPIAERSFEVLDLTADCAGVIIGGCLIELNQQQELT